MDFLIEYEKRKKYIDSLILRYAGEFSTPSSALFRSVSYSISSGGKRLRAILSLEFFEKLGGQMEESFEIFLAALEFLHLYTLVHDDLPCMDNDDYRRGKESTHKVFGQSIALLCGDALLNYAYEMLFYGSKLSSSREKYIDAAIAFSIHTGAMGIIGGQSLEFENDLNPTKDSVLAIYKHKTCDLIIGALAFVASLTRQDAQRVELIKRFGYHFGIAFQIRDDFLDIKEKGKIEKNSLLGLIGEQNADIILKENTQGALECLKKLDLKSDFLEELTNFAANRAS